MTHDRERAQLADQFFKLLLVAAVMWAVKALEVRFQWELAIYGLRPREVGGLTGILTMPFLHSDFEHLGANTLAFIALGMLVYQYYPKVALKTFIWSYFMAGTLLWIGGRPNTLHIGASGVVYALIAFLFFSGLLRKDKRSIAASLITAFLFGSAVWGVLPIQPGISWDGHLLGAFAGLIPAFLYRKVDLPERYLPDDDELERTEHEHAYWLPEDLQSEEEEEIAPERDYQKLDIPWDDDEVLKTWERQQLESFEEQRNKPFRFPFTD